MEHPGADFYPDPGAKRKKARSVNGTGLFIWTKG